MDVPSAPPRQRKITAVSPVLAPIVMEAVIGVVMLLKSDPGQRLAGAAAISGAILFAIAFIILPGRQRERRAPR
jgi:multisubunit Na+/H+ antiporter MnhB subunit